MLHFKRQSKSKQKGFTIIELMVIAPVVILTIGAFITVIVSMTGDVLVSRTANATLFDIQDSLNRIEQDIKLSSRFLATSGDTSNNGFALQTGQGYDDGTAIFKNVSTTNGTILILNSIATTGNPINATSAYVYAIDPLNPCNTAGVIQNTPQVMNIIYFVKSGTLWRRTVMQSNYANTSTNWCNVPWQLPSCSPGYSATFCKADDLKLVSGLGTTGFNVQYFNGSDNTIENTTASDTSVGVTDANRDSALQTATTASVSITSTKTVAGRDSTQAATLRATRLDINASSLVAPAPAPTSPGIPTNVVATGSSTSQVAVSWSSPAGPPTSYTLQYSQKADFSSPTTINNITSTNRTISGLAQATVYFIKVRAANSVGNSSYSGTIMGTSQGSNIWSNYTLITGVGDWNLDGNNDLIGYKSNGDIELHLGSGNATFGGIIKLTNIGTVVRNLLGPGTPSGASAPFLWWANNNTGPGYTLKSDGATGISGSAISSGLSNWISYSSVFTAPKFYSDGTTVLIAKLSAQYIHSLASSGAVTYMASYGSGWDGAFPGDRVFGTGDFTGDGKGDIAGISSAAVMTLYAGTGTGTTGSTYGLGSGWTNDRVMGGWDYNNDGKVDILRYYIPTGVLGFYPGNGAAGFGSPLNTPIN